MDEPGRVGDPMIRSLSYYLQSPPPQVHLQPPPAEFASRGRFLHHQPAAVVPSYNHNSTEKLLLEADLLFNELQASSSPSSSCVLSATRLQTSGGNPLPNAAAASEPAATTKTKARRPAEAAVTSTAAAPAPSTKRQRVEDERRHERVEVSELVEQPRRDSDGDGDGGKKERKSRVAEKNTNKDEREKGKGKRARRSADEAREEDEKDEEEEEERRGRIKRTGGKKGGQVRSAFKRSKGETGKHVCAQHFRDKCPFCKERTPVYFKYGITFAVQGRNLMCLHPLRDFPGEPCGVKFTTQHELVQHQLGHEAAERPGGLVCQKVLDRRLEVSAAVVQRMMKEPNPSESTVRVAALIDRECKRLGYADKYKPSCEVVLQRYRWARFRKLRFDSAKELPTEHMRLRRRLQLEVMEALMREDIPMADLADQNWVVARIAYLWDQAKDQRRGIAYTKSSIVNTIYNWVRRTYTKAVPSIPPVDSRLSTTQKRKRKRKQEQERWEKMNKEEEEEEVQSQSDDGYNNEDSEDTAVNYGPDNDANNYDEDTEDEELATGTEVNDAEKDDDEEEKKRSESGMSSRSRDGEMGGREAAMSILSPSAGGWNATTPNPVREGLTGRELVLARRRHVMQTLDLLLASQLDE